MTTTPLIPTTLADAYARLVAKGGPLTLDEIRLLGRTRQAASLHELKAPKIVLDNQYKLIEKSLIKVGASRRGKCHDCGDPAPIGSYQCETCQKGAT